MQSEYFTAGSNLPLPRAYGPASLRIEKGVFIMNLKGSYEEMGRQNAELAKGIVDEYVASYYLGFIEKVVKHSLGHSAHALPPRLASLIYSIFASLNRKRIGPSLEGLIKGYVDVYGVTPAVGERLALFADILHYLAGKSYAALKSMGCSGLFARGGATKDGKLVIGRNFDFFGRGTWNTNQCVTVFTPSSGRQYLWVGALGLPVGGFGLSKSGIGLMIFTNFCKDVSLSGMPLFTICNDILENAESVDHAVQIVSRHRRIGANTLLITDSRARDAAAVGFSANHVEVLRPENDVLARTNHYITEELQDHEVGPRGWKRHSEARFNRIHDMMEQRRGTLEASDAAAILGDTFDIYENRKRVVGDIVGAVNNSLSVVLSPDDGVINIAHGGFPVCNADNYLGFNLEALFSGADSVSAPDLPAKRNLTENEKKASAHYQEAWSEHLDRFDDARAVYHLRRAAEFAPDEPIFHRVAGILLMKMDRFSAAAEHLEKNAEYQYLDAWIRAEADLWLARCYDLLGRRKEALALYEKARLSGEEEIAAAALRHLNSPFLKKELAPVSVEFVLGSPIAKYS